MRHFFLLIVIVFFALSMNAQMDIPPNGFNPRASISEEVGITSITIKYSRPGVKGREGNIWGKVVAYGFNNYNFLTAGPASPWRAGANEATLISFEHDVKIEGQDIKAGSYALFIALEENKATLIFSNQLGAWGSFNYQVEDDVLRVDVSPVRLEKSVEWLKYEFIEHQEKSCVIALQWENLSIPFKVDVDVDKIVLESVRKEFKGLKGFISANRIHASMYYFEKNENMEEALAWAKMAITGKPYGQTGFSAYENLATGYEKVNRRAEADATMDEGLQIANLGEYINYCRGLIRQKRSTRAIELIERARNKFGDIYALNNSLTSAHSANGDFKKALEYAHKSLKQATSDASKNRIKKNIEKLKNQVDIN